jgi:hypothetical protein
MGVAGGEARVIGGRDGASGQAWREACCQTCTASTSAREGVGRRRGGRLDSGCQGSTGTGGGRRSKVIHEMGTGPPAAHEEAATCSLRSELRAACAVNPPSKGCVGSEPTPQCRMRQHMHDLGASRASAMRADSTFVATVGTGSHSPFVLFSPIAHWRGKYSLPKASRSTLIDHTNVSPTLPNLSGRF